MPAIKSTQIIQPPLPSRLSIDYLEKFMYAEGASKVHTMLKPNRPNVDWWCDGQVIAVLPAARAVYSAADSLLDKVSYYY